jgi:hypothetical protein
MALLDTGYRSLDGEPDLTYEDLLTPVVTPQPSTTQAATTQATPVSQQSTQVGVSQSIIDRLNAIPRNEFETVGFQEGGKDYSMDPNGLISVRDVGAKPTDQVQVFDQGGNFLASHAVEQRGGFVQAINRWAKVGIPAVIGAAILGPAGMGLLNAPAAAAAGSGGSTLLQGGSVEDALKAAALAGLTAYGLDYLNNAAYDLSFAAADAAQLANQGFSAGAIAQNLATYVDPATAISLANNAVTQSFALADANQLTQQGLTTNQVAQVLEQTGLNANTAANIAQAAADGVTTLSASDIIPDVQFQRQTNVNQGLLSPADAERVMVTGQAFDIPNIAQLGQGIGAGVSAATVPTAPQIVTQGGQQVQQAQIEAPKIDPDAASSILSSVLGQPVSVAGSTQRVQVTGETPRQISQAEAAAALSSLTGQQVQITGQTVQTTQVRDLAPAAAGALTPTAPPQSLTVTGQTLAPNQTNVAPAAAAGLLAPTQIAPAQRVETAGQRIPVEDRPIPTLTMAPTIPVKATESVSVEGKREPVPTAAALIPAGAAGAAAGVTKPATQTTNITATDAALAALLLGGAGSLSGGGRPGEPVSGPISGLIPTYPGRGTYQIPELFQIAPTNVYNPFATVAPFGAGRFGAVSQPITLPYGLLAGPLGLSMGINAPTRGLI